MFKLSFVETSVPFLEYKGTKMDNGLVPVYLFSALLSSIIVFFISFRIKKVYIGIVVSSMLLFSATLYKAKSTEIQYSENQVESSEENKSN